MRSKNIQNELKGTQHEPKWHPKSIKIVPWSSLGRPWAPQGAHRGPRAAESGIWDAFWSPQRVQNEDENHPKMKSKHVLISG